MPAKVELEQSKNSRGKNWVARITGTDPKYGFAREFVQGVVTGSRAHYQLTDGIYQIAEPRSLGKTYRYFARVSESEMTKISEDELAVAILEMDAKNA